MSDDKSQSASTYSNEKGSGDEVLDSKEEDKLSTLYETTITTDENDNEIFFEISSDEKDLSFYFEEYEQFCKFVRTQIEQSMGVHLDQYQPNLSFKQFRELMSRYDDNRTELEKNLRLQFQPNVVVVKNGMLCQTPNHQPTGNQSSTKKAIQIVEEQVYIYPNELTFG